MLSVPITILSTPEMSTKRRGTKREHDCMKLLVDEGWLVTRASNSLGAADLLAGRGGVCQLVQVKATKAGPFSGFGPADRRELLDAAEAFGASAVLCWWPPDRRGPRFMLPDCWPKT